MAISGPGFGAAAGTVGQLLMQKVFQDREREERERARQATADYRGEQLNLARLRALTGPGERAATHTPGMGLPEGGRLERIGGQTFSILPPPPKPVEPDLPFRVSTDGISTDVGTLEEAIALRDRGAAPEPPKAVAAGRDVSPTGAQLRGAAERDVGMMLTEGEFDVQDPAHRQVIAKSLQGKYPALRGEIPGMVSERVGEAEQDDDAAAVQRIRQAYRESDGGTDFQSLRRWGYERSDDLFEDARRLGLTPDQLEGRLSGPSVAPAVPAPEPTAAPPTPTEAPVVDEVARARGSVQAARAQGKDDASIRDALRAAGFTDAEIAQVMGG